MFFINPFKQWRAVTGIVEASATGKLEATQLVVSGGMSSPPKNIQFGKPQSAFPAISSSNFRKYSYIF